MKKSILNIIGLISISLMIAASAQAQWKIDDGLKDAKLKVDYNEDNITAGKAIYDSRCKACHRDIVTAEKNDRALPSAPNLGNKEFQSTNADGEIFCKIAYGNGGGMPPFEKQISDADKWKVIAYLRSYYPAYKAPTASAQVAAPVNSFKGTLDAIKLSYDSENNKIVAQLSGQDGDGNSVKPKGVKVSIYVKRYFGELPLCDGEKTDANGMLSIPLGNLPTDTLGFIIVKASAANNAVSTETKLKVSDGYHWKNPLDGRHLWAVRAKTPLWLLITYLTVTISVLAIIAWAFFQLFRIYNLRER